MNDTLDALKRLVSYVEKYKLNTWAPEGDTILDLARDAIAKEAKGDLYERIGVQPR